MGSSSNMFLLFCIFQSWKKNNSLSNICSIIVFGKEYISIYCNTIICQPLTSMIASNESFRALNQSETKNIFWPSKMGCVVGVVKFFVVRADLLLKTKEHLDTNFSWTCFGNICKFIWKPFETEKNINKEAKKPGYNFFCLLWFIAIRSKPQNLIYPLGCASAKSIGVAGLINTPAASVPWYLSSFSR